MDMGETSALCQLITLQDQLSPTQQTKVTTMRSHQPSRKDLKAWVALLESTANGPVLTPTYLRELAAKRDAYQAALSN